LQLAAVTVGDPKKSLLLEVKSHANPLSVLRRNRIVAAEEKIWPSSHFGAT
jgi:hypothetical protein